ncbi:site-specific DNA-methyltransferase [Haemophilus haemoglobinophilus]|nr:site-specific DNA-methyltransferase [Canicola haemoglobinophilus]
MALHSLATQFRNKVKLIYIDPPYNTGNDGFKYNDKFNHSTWLTFMKNRLEIAKELLRDDGVIFVQCDDNEQAYIKILMDEIFDRENFINTITLKMSTPSGTKMSHINKKIIKTKEYILCYSKSKDYILFNPQYEIKDGYDWEYGFFLEKNNSENIEDWEVKKLTDVLLENGMALNKNSLPDMNKKEFKDFYLKNSHLIWARGRHHNIPKDIYEKSQKNKDKIFEYHNGIETQYAYRGRRLAFLNKTVKKCVDKTGNPTVDISQAICDFWDFIKTSKLFAEGNVEFNNGKKPELIIKTLIDMTTQEGDIILDYHLGSGTTAAVAHKMNRQYIGIEQMGYIETLSVERLKKVIEGEQGGISKAVNWQGGGDFVYFELTQFNQTAKELIQHCKNFAQLAPLFEQLCEQYFLKYNLNIEQFSKIMQEVEFQQLSLDEQKQMMLEMLDLNQLYVNLSDIEDEQFTACLSDEDRELNQQFYGVK